MSRDDGFDVADVATGFYDDPKVRALWRSIGEPGRMSHALVLHMATLLASWRHGCRVTVIEAAPLWLDPDPALIAELKKAHLLDAAGRIPVRSWKGWFEPASERRDLLRGRWTRANQRRRKQASEVPALLPRGDHSVTATPVRPSVRHTVRPSGAGAREGTVQGTKNGRGGLVPLADLLPDAYASLGPKP